MLCEEDILINETGNICAGYRGTVRLYLLLGSAKRLS
jgi:hypothetical protein